MKPAIASLFCAIAACPLMAVGQQPPRQLHGVQSKLAQISDLGSMEGKDLSALQKTEVMLTWFVEERRAPAPTRLGASGDPVDSTYIQAQIGQMLLSEGDLRAIKWLATSKRLKPAAVRNLLFVGLNDPTDVRSRDALIDTLLGDPNPWMRQQAAIRLPSWRDKVVVDALKIALNDPYSVLLDKQSHTDFLNKEPKGITYPVRDSAEEALKAIENWSDGRARGVERWKTAFAKRMDGYDRFVKEHASDLERMLKIANSDRPSRQ